MMQTDMKTNEIKKLVKKITGFEYIAVRKGTGSMSGLISIFSSINDNKSFKPFEQELRKAFQVEIFSYYTVSIKAL